MSSLLAATKYDLRFRGMILVSYIVNHNVGWLGGGR